MNDYILYILMRNDLPSMNTGKAMAQALHAGHLFSHQNRNKLPFQEWAGENGFGTTVVLSVNKSQLDAIRQDVGTNDTYKETFEGMVTDDTYPTVVASDVVPLINQSVLSAPIRISDDGKEAVLYRREVTCSYLFGSKELLKPILGELETY